MGHDLTIAEAETLVRAAAAAASDRSIAVAVVVVDRGGHELLVRRHHDAILSSARIAGAKAFTALSFRAPTHVTMERLGSVERAIHASQADPRLAFLKGGCPLIVDGVAVGAIGVSGGSADQDLECCEVGIASWQASA